MSKPKYPSTRADFVALPDNFTPVQSFDSSQVHGNTPLNTAIAQLLRAVINVGNIAALETDDKTNIVNAINEIIANAPIVKTADNGFCIVAHGTNKANKATAQNAFAEGGKTEAAGTTSHAEGSYTSAEGASAHAEGQGTIASGLASHSEGSDTYAAGNNAHAEGNGKITIFLKQAYTQGDLTIVTDVPYPYNTELESPRTQERVSVVSVQESQGVYICGLARAFSENIATNQPLNAYGGALSENSHAEGCGTIAARDSAHTEGYGTIANGLYAKASGEWSYALGRASEATCKGTQALNEAEFATGAYNKSTSNVTLFSVGIGADEEHRANAFEITTDGKMYVKGVGNYDGTNATATGVKALGEEGWCPSFPFGVVSGYLQDNYSVSNGIIDKENNPNIAGAFVIGLYNKVVGVNSFAHGSRNTATGSYSHAEGYSTDAVGNRSHSEGDHTNANGVASHSEGENTNATGNYSHAEGFASDAVGNNSHAEGSNTTALGQSSHAEGYYTKTLGEYSHAEGWNTLTRNKGEHACGRYNFSTTDVTLFSIGCGDEGEYGASSTRQNAFEVDVNGNIYIKGIGNYQGMNIGQSGVESVQEVIARLVQALGGNNS